MSSPFPSNAALDPNLPHDSLVPKILGICSAMTILVTLVAAARFLIRWKYVEGRFGADDWCILVAWVLAAAFNLDPLNRKCRSVLLTRCDPNYTLHCRADPVTYSRL